MNKIKKATGKLLSLILAAAMCVSLVPGGGITALADDDGLDYGIRKLNEGSTPSTSEVQTYATSYGMAYVARGDTDIYWATSDGRRDHDTTTFVVSGASSGETSVYCIQLGTTFVAGEKMEYDLLGYTDSDGITFDQKLIDQIALAQYYIEGLSYSRAIREGLKQVYIWRLLDLNGYENKMYLDPDDYNNGHASGISIDDQKSIYKAATNYATENAKRYYCWGRVFSSGANQDMAQFFCTPNTGYLTLKKTSANTEITDSNSCYSLEGAKYKVYTDKDCENRAEDVDGNRVTLTTDENGNTGTVEMKEGTYYVKETKAAKGYMLCDGKYSCKYSADGVHEVTVTADNTEDNPATVECIETPGNDPAGITLYKIDADTGEPVPEGAAGLEGAQFTVKYYDGYYDGDTLPDEATRTWVIETKQNAYDGTYDAYLADDYKVSGDDFYYSTLGGVTLPLGTYTVQETLAPEGYLLEGGGTAAPVHLGQVTLDDNTVGSLSIGNELKIDEPVIRGGVEVQKRDVESLRDDPQGSGSFEGITLEITNESDAAVRVDSDGDGVLEKFGPGDVVMTLTTDGNGYAATSSDALPYGSYAVTETAVPGVTDHRTTAAEQDDGYLLGSDDGAAYTANLSIDFEIREEGVIVNLTGAPTENGDSAVNAEEAITDQVKRGDITLTKHDEATQEAMSVPFRVTSLTTGESHVFWTDENGDYSSDSTWNAHSYRTDAGEDYSDGLWFYGYEDWDSFVTYGDDGYMTDNGYVDNGDGWVTLYDDVHYYNLTPGATYGIYGAASFEDMYLEDGFFRIFSARST